jgi:MSHA biogenesis protein MshP
LALFLITVLALLVVGMAQLQQSTGQSISLQIQSQRAFFAAESGAQVAVAEALAANCAAVSSPLSFSAGGLASCEAVLTCDAVQADIDGNSSLETVYTLSSTGSCGSGSDFAERVVEVRVR